MMLSFYAMMISLNIEAMKGSEYNIEEAVTVMRNCAKFGQDFSITFKKISGGSSRIERAELRPMAPTSKDINGKYKLQLTNKETGERKSCYIVLIMEVNGLKVRI